MDKDLKAAIEQVVLDDVRRSGPISLALARSPLLRQEIGRLQRVSRDMERLQSRSQCQGRS